jgi:hypothetical protein
MARKRRTFDQVPLPASSAKTTTKYEDPFQKAVGKRIEDAAGIFEGQGRNILYGLAAAVVLGLVIWIIYSWTGRTSSEAQTALGKAIEISQAQISETPPLAGSNQKSYKTIKDRSDAAIAEFQNVVDKFGGPAGEKANYFLAVNKLFIDRQAGTQELQSLASGTGEVGTLSKFALAQVRANDGQTDEAIKLYQELASASDPVVAKETIQFELAKQFEKAGRKDDAVNVLFDLVKTASEAKDLEGKAVPLTSTAQSAKDKLKELDPEKAKEIPEAVPDTPGGVSFGE